MIQYELIAHLSYHKM